MPGVQRIRRESGDPQGFGGRERRFLKRGEIPHHKVGTHRRIYVGDLLAYKAKRDSNRRKILDDLSRAEADEGLYDLEPPDDRAE
jgi:hypothetical protein